MLGQCNISQYLRRTSEDYPEKEAVYFRDMVINYRQLDNLSNYYALSLSESGIKKDARVLVMLRPGIEFLAVVFGIFKNGACPILIDPGMGRENMLNCIKKTSPHAMIGIPLANFIRHFFPGSFNSVEEYFSIGSFFPGCRRLLNFTEFSALKKDIQFDIEVCGCTETAAIVFTTGSTGPPKGVVYTHGIYITQMKLIAAVYGAGPEMFDMPAFPLFGLFSAAMGMPCVIPDINPSLPAHVSPEVIIDTIKKFNVSFSFASPALWFRVCSYCRENNIKLPSLRRILMAGAPVSSELHKLIFEIAPNAETMVPYGATEALPAVNMRGSDLSSDIAGRVDEGQGYCVGRVIESIDVHIIQSEDGPLRNWDDVKELAIGETGEIVVGGDIVTPEYYNLSSYTVSSKIIRDGKILHRMGDMGYFDSDGYLWFKGRKSHRVFTESGVLYPVCCEAIFNKHPKVFRSALVGLGDSGKEVPVIVIEPIEGVLPLSKEARDEFIKELCILGENYEFTSNIKKFLFFSPFPVDIRHNAKIFREKLKHWARKFQDYL